MVWLPGGEKRYVYSFWKNSRTWQTDGQTDGHRMTAYAALHRAAKTQALDATWIWLYVRKPNLCPTFLIILQLTRFIARCLSTANTRINTYVTGYTHVTVRCTSIVCRLRRSIECTLLKTSNVRRGRCVQALQHAGELFSRLSLHLLIIAPVVFLFTFSYKACSLHPLMSQPVTSLMKRFRMQERFIGTIKLIKLIILVTKINRHVQ